MITHTLGMLQGHAPHTSFQKVHPARPQPDVLENKPQVVTVPHGARIYSDIPSIVHLSVGGTLFCTTAQTLTAAPNSMLGRMFSGEHPLLRDQDGTFVIDRDGRHFHHILNYLRDGTVPIGLSRVDRIEILREVDYFGIKPLYSILGGPTVAAAQMSGGGGGEWLQALALDIAQAEAADFNASTHSHRVYARLRSGLEYSGDWIVSSPRNLQNVEYELYDACLARDPITALNKMGAAGFRPCTDPPEVPSSSRCRSDNWEIMMYKDVWQ
jgi:hypothetical protein